ncbi:MAG TPA: hypothetical protein VK576_07770, partial [Thermoleophilia bacterium]|nr:hypothetical protein [Thermoleophilia bacterium]
CAGIYVSSGAAGLALGIAVGKADLAVWPLAVALCALAVAIALTTARKATPGGVTPGPAPTCSVRPVERRVQTLAWPAGGDSLVLLLLLAVAVRSYVGLALVLPWKHDPWLLAAFTSAIVAGKAGGGLTADVFGWRRIGLAGLLGSAPLLAMAGTSPVAGIVGIALFNTTMPITLAAVARLLPGHEGFAFGLTCLALFAGAAPVLTGWAPPLTMPAIAVLTAVAAAALWLGLRPWSPPTPAPTGGVALLPATITRGGQR